MSAHDRLIVLGPWMWVTPRLEGPYSASGEGRGGSRMKPSSSTLERDVLVVGLVVVVVVVAVLPHCTKYVMVWASALMTEAKREWEGYAEGDVGGYRGGILGCKERERMVNGKMVNMVILGELASSRNKDE